MPNGAKSGLHSSSYAAVYSDVSAWPTTPACALLRVLFLFPSSKKASDEVVYLCRDFLLSELAFKDSIIRLSDKRFFKLSDKRFSRNSIVQDDIRSKCNDLLHII